MKWWGQLVQNAFWKVIVRRTLFRRKGFSEALSGEAVEAAAFLLGRGGRSYLPSIPRREQRGESSPTGVEDEGGRGGERWGGRSWWSSRRTWSCGWWRIRRSAIARRGNTSTPSRPSATRPRRCGASRSAPTASGPSIDSMPSCAGTPRLVRYPGAGTPTTTSSLISRRLGTGPTRSDL